jgi:hypothetical protein
LTRSFRLLAVAFLAVVLALSSAQNAFATVELAYDNGVFFMPVAFTLGGILFSLPTGVSSAHLRYVRFVLTGAPTPTFPLTIHITRPDHVTELSGSPITFSGVGALPTGIGCPAGWTACYGFDVTSYGIVVTGDFFVILDTGVTLAEPVFDSAVSGPPSRSYVGATVTGLAGMQRNNNAQNCLLRVDIDPIVAPVGPVGGFMEPVNKLVVFAPYLALLGVLAVIVIAASPWKKRGN